MAYGTGFAADCGCIARPTTATTLIRPTRIVDPAAFARLAKRPALNHRTHGLEHPHAPQHGVGIARSRWPKDRNHFLRLRVFGLSSHSSHGFAGVIVCGESSTHTSTSMPAAWAASPFIVSPPTRST